MTAPAGILINSIRALNPYSDNIGNGSGWWGEFYWNGGPGASGRSAPLTDSFSVNGCCAAKGLRSQSIGWFFACRQSSCSSIAELTVGELQLTAEEDRAPSLAPLGDNNVWYQAGWVRGVWNASLRAADPSGACGAFVAFGTGLIATGRSEIPNRHSWKQCLDQSVLTVADTRTVGDGSSALRFTATNAANVTANLSKPILVDNSTPTISLSGPTDMPTTAGPQYVAAIAGGSPSGIAGISCSTDGGPPIWSAGSTTRVRVDGAGQHTVRCAAANNAVDPAGNHGWSPVGTWSLKIGTPTSLGISFVRIVNSLRCHRARARIRVPARWITVTHNHQRFRVRSPAFTRTVMVTRCHPHTARRRVVVWTVVRRHGRPTVVRRVKVMRIVLAPRAVRQSVRVVPFGRATTVSGWLGRSDGTALSYRRIRILTALADGRNRFTQIGAVVTAADGSWSERIGAGPSRRIEAVYDGDADTESSASVPVRLNVPARIRIQVRPTVVPWGGQTLITGRLLGGFIPPNSNVLKLVFGHGPRPHTIGTPSVRPDGRFTIRISWSTGRGALTYWFAVATLAEADYPYAPGMSRRVAVTVG